MARMTGGEAVVKSLVAEGVDVVFGIPSLHSVAIYDALYSHPQVRHVTTRHEQGAAYMADGYARASGKPGIFITSSGPGACNSITAMGEAYFNSSPVINITTVGEKRLIGVEKGAIHELKDQLGAFRSVTGWSVRVESVGDIPHAIHAAFGRVRTQRPRPIVLEFPVDVVQGSGEVAIPAPEVLAKPAGNAAKIARAADCLAGSKKPVIWAGGGVNSAGANAELVHLAELLQAPVLTTAMGKTAMSNHHPLYLGRLALGGGGSRTEKSPVVKLLEESDLLIAIGTKFGALDTLNWTLPLPDQIIHIDIDETQFGRNYPYKMGITGDARLVLGHLIQALGNVARPSRSVEVAAIRDMIYGKAKQRAPAEMQMAEDIRAVAGPGAILCVDQTAATYWAGIFSKATEPRTEMGPYGFSGLGFGFPAGLGAKVACPDKPVIVLAGDGGFMFTSQELATAMQFGINIALVIFNDNSFGSIREKQKLWFEGRYIGESLRNPDFVKFAGSFGATAVEVPGLSGLKEALKQALAAKTTSVIVVPKALVSSTADGARPSPMAKSA